MSEVWKISMDFCRCCLESLKNRKISEQENIDLWATYKEMMRDTFGIQVKNEAVECKPKFICEGCSTRLREAHSFKLMVLQNEETLTSYIKNNDRPHDGSTGEDFKMALIKVERLDKRHDNEVDDDHDFEDDEILANLKSELNRGKQRSASPENLFTGNTQEIVSKNRYRSNLKDISHGKVIKKDWIKLVQRRGNGPILRENTMKQLANSTICVFQWDKSRYRCFCCKEPFSDMDELRDHTTKEHTLKDIEKKIVLQQNRLVKVEISKLFCKLCNLRVENLNNLKMHLTEHGVTFELNEDLLVPFKIEADMLQCQICLEKFKLFRLLNIHMNRHFQKQVCHICGAGFSNLVFLNLHKTRSHRPLSCKNCDLEFSTKNEKRNHEVNVHGVKLERKLRFPCPYCEARFFQENFRVQHLVDQHGMKKPEYNCRICPKVFITRSLCNNHLKNVHMKEKSHQCDVCHSFFYTKSDVARHKVTHTGEKKFKCGLCQNFFATKDSLRRHMKRTHTVH